VNEPSQIIVVDNGSSDIAITEKQTQKDGVRLLKLENNLGYGSAINHAVQQLSKKYKILLICNPDVELNPKAVNMLSQVIRNEAVGLAGPRILNKEGLVYPSARSIPSIRNGVGHAIFANTWPSNPWTKNYLSEAHLQNQTISTGWLSGACLVIRRDLFHQIGGFDEKYFMYFEDVDLGFRLCRLGFKNLYVPEVSITHIGGESTKVAQTSMLKTHHESAMRFLSVKYKGVMWAPVRAVLKTGLAVRFKIQARKATT
jgi:N-acetylglucosaminyl-diphospho-decaprenol L-rhamnosyltransferase